MKEQNSIKKNWWQRNKKKVFVIGGVVLAIGTGITLYYLTQNKKSIVSALHKTTAKAIPKANNAISSKIVKSTSEAVAEVALAKSATDQIATEPSVIKETAKMIEVSVNKVFIRNLPEGWHHSAEKAAEALKLGIELATNQTIVDPFSYMRATA